jgi:hypothetical protein
VFKKKQEMIKARNLGFIAGSKRAAVVARKLVESGWTDMATFEAKVVRRARSPKK